MFKKNNVELGKFLSKMQIPDPMKGKFQLSDLLKIKNCKGHHEQSQTTGRVQDAVPSILRAQKS